MSGIKYISTFLAVAALAPFLQGQDAAGTPPAEENPQTQAAETQPAETASVPATENLQEKTAAATTSPANPEASPKSGVPAEQPAQGVPATDAAPAGAEADVPAAAETGKKLTENQKKQLRIRILAARKAKIDAEIALGKARLAERLAPQTAARARLDAENALRAARTAAKLAELDAAKKKLDAELARDKAREALELLEKQSKVSEAELDLKIARLEQELELAKYVREIEQVKTAETLRGLVAVPADAEPVYLKDPLTDGRLRISDRRIEFNGPVTQELADYICERIYFYNNRNAEYPIFIVIDSSPGGNVAAGYQIMKAMESSKAPVYVVVKTYAASMAAIITTFAERAFCYPNTVILQHQPSANTKGNLTQMREALDFTTEWTRNINDLLAKKMGLTYEEYVAEMYKHNSRGDWSEFGEGAQRWKWVTDVVDTMEEQSFVRREKTPGVPARNVPGTVREYKIDERGRPYIELPTLPAGDAWMIYDPANLYRTSR